MVFILGILVGFALCTVIFIFIAYRASVNDMARWICASDKPKDKNDKEESNKIQDKFINSPFKKISDDLYDDKISIGKIIEEHIADILFEYIGCPLNKNNPNNITFQPDNIFTLMFIHTGKLPPTMFMKDSGSGKDSFEFEEFKYSFIYDDELGHDVPKIEHIVKLNL